MSRFACLLVAVCGLGLVVVPSRADDPKPAKKADPLEQALAALEQEFQLKDNDNLNEIPLFELLQTVAKRHNLSVVINDDAFKALGHPNIKEEKPTVAAIQLRGCTVRQVLNTVLECPGATYLLKNGTVEIVPTRLAAKVTKSAVAEEDEGGRPRLKEPLVSAIFKEKPLNEAVAKLAEMYDLTAVVAPQAGDAKTGFVTARLLNMPADKALELLAVQCDLRVVRKGAAFLLTSKEHANELFGEKLDKERQKIELEKLREAPAVPPQKPAPAPEK